MARRTRVKICGITRLQDAHLAQELGVDSLGFVFVPASARHVIAEDAAVIVNQLSPFVTPVGLFLNPTVEEVQHALNLMPSMVPQFHGQESGEFCDQFGRPYLKAIGVGAGKPMPEESELRAFGQAIGFLFDSNEPGQLGGTGHAFDWARLGEKMHKPLILAGGLNVHNVAQAIKQVAPFAVDVSSGVEQAKGIKDSEAMHAFMAAVRHADEQVLE
ncbi:phosphoribosylanthranilate isomerase [Granulosicoccus antarcticus]|uniref:N-(5'-phosphoribosyl)anthranilate isomerase n=1 Tax=Granulosicoccus antarcticus IMCC3135 TaxID=1192854 RepID=A0A2Z2P663_9GAMM|nr:phosphoribosylanthranilate isomerase [Granulosicoccus antarcticus]ASJ75334.1 N-(5'-phosphoribosyl)anthranilate isomerase [Granulosicoccus antarcticus IMCC3135]